MIADGLTLDELFDTVDTLRYRYGVTVITEKGRIWFRPIPRAGHKAHTGLETLGEAAPLVQYLARYEVEPLAILESDDGNATMIMVETADLDRVPLTALHDELQRLENALSPNDHAVTESFKRINRFPAESSKAALKMLSALAKEARRVRKRNKSVEMETFLMSTRAGSWVEFRLTGLEDKTLSKLLRHQALKGLAVSRAGNLFHKGEPWIKHSGGRLAVHVPVQWKADPSSDGVSLEDLKRFVSQKSYMEFAGERKDWQGRTLWTWETRRNGNPAYGQPGPDDMEHTRALAAQIEKQFGLEAWEFNVDEFAQLQVRAPESVSEAMKPGCKCDGDPCPHCQKCMCGKQHESISEELDKATELAAMRALMKARRGPGSEKLDKILGLKPGDRVNRAKIRKLGVKALQFTGDTYLFSVPHPQYGRRYGKAFYISKDGVFKGQKKTWESRRSQVDALEVLLDEGHREARFISSEDLKRLADEAEQTEGPRGHRHIWTREHGIVPADPSLTRLERKAMPPQMKRCVADLIAKGKSKDAAFAICTDTFQRSGQMKPGEDQRDLTAKGKKRAKELAKKKDHSAKVQRYKTAIGENAELDYLINYARDLGGCS